MNEKNHYVSRLLARYQRLPGTLGRVLRDDRHLAGALYDRRIGLDLIHQAFILALARRAFRADDERLEPIRTLRYFLPIIEEILAAAPDPTYLQHLASRLRDARLYPPD